MRGKEASVPPREARGASPAPRKCVTKPPLAIIVCSGVCTPLQLMLQPSAQTIETARRALLAAKSFSTAEEQAGQDAEDGGPKTKVARMAVAWDVKERARAALEAEQLKW